MGSFWAGSGRAGSKRSAADSCHSSRLIALVVVANIAALRQINFIR